MRGKSSFDKLDSRSFRKVSRRARASGTRPGTAIPKSFRASCLASSEKTRRPSVPRAFGEFALGFLDQSPSTTRFVNRCARTSQETGRILMKINVTGSQADYTVESRPRGVASKIRYRRETRKGVCKFTIKCNIYKMFFFFISLTSPHSW